MATVLHTMEAIHSRVMNYVVCDTSMVAVEKIPTELRVVVTLPLNALLIEPSELESVVKAGLPAVMAVDVEAVS